MVHIKGPKFIYRPGPKKSQKRACLGLTINSDDDGLSMYVEEVIITSFNDVNVEDYGEDLAKVLLIFK